MPENEVTTPPQEEMQDQTPQEIPAEAPMEATPETPTEELKEGIEELHEDLQEVKEAVEDAETWNNGGPFKMAMPKFPESYRLYPKGYEIYLPADKLHPITDAAAVLERLKTPVPFN